MRLCLFEVTRLIRLDLVEPYQLIKVEAIESSLGE